jgi:Methyltransferase domain
VFPLHSGQLQGFEMIDLLTKNVYDGFDLSKYKLDLQGWHGSSPVFGRLVERLRPKLIIEVGSWKGLSATTMATAVKQLGLDTKIICIDTWLGATEFIGGTGERDLAPFHGYPTVYYQFIANVLHLGLQDIIVPFPQSSINAARWLRSKNVTAELIYLDASHEEDDVRLDLAAYYPLVASGGVLFGDDYGTAWPGVANAVDAFAPCQLELPFWFIDKP